MSITKKMRLIGYAVVDSGQLLIVDPCYLGSWRDGEANDPDSHYGQACALTISKKSGGEMLISGIAGNGVALSTNGDGKFAVYGCYRSDGSLSRIEIRNL